MLDLLETIAGAVVLAAYFGVAVVLPAGVVVLFVALIGTLIRTGLDVVIGLVPARVREITLVARIGRALRRAFIWSVGTLLFLALVGTSSAVPAANIFASGFAQMVVTLAAIQDIVAQWFTGEQLGDMLVVLVPTAGSSPITALRDFQVLVAVHWFDTLQPGVNSLAFRWTFAAFATSIAGIYVVFEPLRAVRKRVAVLIAPPSQQVTLTESSLQQQAEMIAQALARATPAAAPAAPAQAVSAWARPGLARAAAPSAMAAPAPGAVVSQRVAVVTWDGELATELERQLDSAGFSPLVMRSVAEAFASRVWPAIVFIDARHLQWLSPDRLPLLVRARLVAITREGVRVPAGWQLDTHSVESGGDALLDLLRRRDVRRRAGTREPGA
jgi:hypothetical protein